jgi:5-methylcytosine-specific restriction endonuclease McrA
VYSKGDKIDALTLFNLFGWTCYLCREPIDRGRRCPDWKAATIEHLTPISMGGTHTWDNVVPAHYKCNMEKSDLPWAAAPVMMNA